MSRYRNSNTRVPTWLVVATLGGLLIFGQTASASVQAQISSREAFVGQPIVLQLQVSAAAAMAAPTFPRVDGLDIQSAGSPSRGSQVTIINGRRTETHSVTHTYRLTPRRAGIFEIPAIQVRTQNGIEWTQPFRISATKSETGDLMFAEITGQRQEIFVGEPLDVTLKIWLKPFSDRALGITLSPNQMWQLISEDQTDWGGFKQTLESLAEQRRGVQGVEVLRKDNAGVEREYYLYEIDATIYPKASGQLKAEDVQIVANYPTQLGQARDPFASMFSDSIFGDDPFFQSAMSPFRKTLTVTNSRPIAAQPEVIDIQVDPLPLVGQPADFRGAVGDYIVVTQASPSSVAAGDPVTLQIGIRGTGPMELVQAPPLARIPEFARDFRVTDEPLAGVVDGDTKVFVTTIRPRNEEVAAIPGVPFSFFDPATGSYRTATSDPIPLSVSPAESLALDSIVGNVATNDSHAPSNGPNINVKLYEGASVISEPWSIPWRPLLFGFGVLWMVAPVGYVLGKYSRPSRLQQVRSEISQAAHAGEISNALNRWMMSDGGLQLGDDPVRIREAYGKDFENQLYQLSIDCDQAAFAGSPEVTLDILQARALELVAERPRQPLNKLWQVPGSGLAMGIAFCGLFLMATAILAPTRTREGESVPTQLALSRWQQAQLLDEATTAYAAGLSSPDATQAREAFAESATKFETLLESGVSSGKLYYNLANAQALSGNLEQAIKNYEQAKGKRPWSWRGLRNLRVVQQYTAVT
ncbi:MAG: BatD family protein [Planctomycetota bacterium]